MNALKPCLSLFSVSVTLAILAASLLHAGNIDPAGDGHKFAFGENIGWNNLADSQGPGVTVNDTYLSGFIWSENIGWINLAPVYGGISHDGHGNLSGYAWSENAGWINFSCETESTCARVDYGVTIDPVTGTLSGYAWGENIGWISFEYTGFVNADDNYAVTGWRINGDVNSSGSVMLEDAILALQTVAGITPAPEVFPGADVNGDIRIGLEESIYILNDIADN